MAMTPVSHKTAQLAWVKSSHCADHTCLEAAALGEDSIAVRDSKNIDQPHLTISRGEWIAFIDAVATGGYTFN